jgi:hypothetical protein
LKQTQDFYDKDLKVNFSNKKKKYLFALKLFFLLKVKIEAYWFTIRKSRISKIKFIQRLGVEN